jgi:hypothetical protein
MVLATNTARGARGNRVGIIDRAGHRIVQPPAVRGTAAIASAPPYDLFRRNSAAERGPGRAQPRPSKSEVGRKIGHAFAVGTLPATAHGGRGRRPAVD